MMALLQVPTPPAPPSLPDPNLIASQVQEVVMFVLGMIVVTIIAVKVLGPIARAFARRLEGKIGDPELRADIDQVHERLHELEQMRTRIAELEERVEFSERLLSQRRDQDLLKPGGSGA